MSDAESPQDRPDNGDIDEIDETRHDDGDDSDKDSDVLSEIDEDQFVEPVEIDSNVASTLKAAKRKKVDGDGPRKPKETRRPKKRTRDNEDDADMGDVEPTERRQRKPRAEGERRAPAPRPEEPEENEEDLPPEERRRRALDRAMDAAIKNPIKRRRKKDEIDLEEELDEHIAQLKVKMEKACEADNAARDKDEPAVHKLSILPQVTALLNRTDAQDSVLDPDTNFLQTVRFFLEPLNDASLPAYSIQRDIFRALMRLPVTKDTLVSSGIGKIVLFYTRSTQPQLEIKRMAERLVGEWSRMALKRTDDYKKRHIETREFNYSAAKLAQRQEAATGGSQLTLTQRSLPRHEIERQRILAPEVANSNRAQAPGLPATYTVAPKSTFDGRSGGDFRPIGAAATEAFRRMTQKKGKR
ncbi:hypothetical protein GQ53DRAFT_846321 [Thozetella sp. PMI_491]|nr:hypothetical protein GQ53DRAFT_846321 [Thozetella sp. PMI_491]